MLRALKRLLAHSQRSAGQGCDGAVLTIVDDGEGCRDLEEYTALGHDEDPQGGFRRARAFAFAPHCLHAATARTRTRAGVGYVHRLRFPCSTRAVTARRFMLRALAHLADPGLRKGTLCGPRPPARPAPANKLPARSRSRPLNPAGHLLTLWSRRQPGPGPPGH